MRPLGLTGHYRGSLGVEEQIAYVSMLEDGSQRTDMMGHGRRGKHEEVKGERKKSLG